VLAVPGLSFAEVTETGVQRVSVGGKLAWVAVKAMAEAAVAIRDAGDFSALATRLPLTDWFSN
jgi:2-methylisocitrate lyase-like PEP mutase family enzyme